MSADFAKHCMPFSALIKCPLGLISPNNAAPLFSFNHMVHCYGVLPLGLLRPKPENPAWRLTYVAMSPAWADVMRKEDRVFVIRRGDELIAARDSEAIEDLPYGLKYAI